MTPGHANKAQLWAILRDRFGADLDSEVRFHPTRRWRFDYAVPRLRLAIEYNGHGHTGKKRHIGGHASVTGMAGDAEKLNAAQSLGWTVLQFTALHFAERDRRKHKLTSPHEMIGIAAWRLEKKAHDETH